MLEKLGVSSKLIRYIFIALVLRLVLMPFFAHGDIILTYTRAYDAAFNGVNVFSFNEPIPHIIEMVNLWIYDIFFPREWLSPLTASLSENPYTMLNIFWFKLPYLILDILGIALLTKMYDFSKDRYLRVFSYIYLFNPILIFATYIFGRYETFPIFFLLLAIKFLKDKELLRSSLSLGGAILMRASFLMLIPAFFWSVSGSYKKRLKYTIYVLLPYLAISLYKVVFLNIGDEAKWISSGQHTNYLLSSRLELGYDERLFIFPVVFGVYMLALYLGGEKNLKPGPLAFAKISVTTLLLYYLLGNYHPQYLSWIMPLLLVLGLEMKSIAESVIKVLPLITVLFVGYLLRWSNAILPGALAPTGDFLSQRHLAGWVGQFISPRIVANLARSGLASIYIVLLFQINRLELFKLLSRK